VGAKLRFLALGLTIALAAIAQHTIHRGIEIGLLSLAAVAAALCLVDLYMTRRGLPRHAAGVPLAAVATMLLALSSILVYAVPIEGPIVVLAWASTAFILERGDAAALSELGVGARCAVVSTLTLLAQRCFSSQAALAIAIASIIGVRWSLHVDRAFRANARAWLRPALRGLFAIVISTLLLLVGGVLGRHLAYAPFKQRIREDARAETLGRLERDPSERRAMARAYHDPDATLERLDEITWAVANVPTPFVGNAPEPGTHGTASINWLQLRSTKDVVIPKPTGVVRIFFTGGSTAFGSGAPTQERTIGGYLEAGLNAHLSPRTNLHYEVFTAANPAWASTHERILIENRLTELEPDLVISLSGVNDVQWGWRGRNVLWFRSFADDHFSSLLGLAHEAARRPPLVDPTEISPAPVPTQLVVDRFEKNLNLAAHALTLSGTAYVLFLQPNIFVGTKPLTTHEQQVRARSPREQCEYFANAYRTLKERLPRVRLENFAWDDISDMFAGDADEIFVDSFHFGDRGNERVARRVLADLSAIPLSNAVLNGVR
jgi:hypothetical protein